MKEERLPEIVENSDDSLPDILYESCYLESHESLEESHFINKILTDQRKFTYREVPTRKFEELLNPDLDFYIKIREKNRYELLEDRADLSPLGKCIRRIYLGFTDFCLLVISSSKFEFLIITIIVLNIIAMALEDPLSMEQDPFLEQIDTFCLYMYTIEAALKIGGLGLITHKQSYLRDSWNILDLIILITAWIERTAQEGVNLSALRSLRVFRPLRSISSIEGLKVLIIAIINSIQPLLLSLMVFVFFLCIFAIAGKQLWMGIFRMRCLRLSTGEYDGDLACKTCPVGFECAESLDNFEQVHFDNIFYAILSVFQCVTLEGWSLIMEQTQSAFSFYVFIYYIPLVFIGAFLLLNFTLAVIKSSFTRAMNQVREREEPEEDDNSVILKDGLNNEVDNKNSSSRINSLVSSYRSQCMSELLETPHHKAESIYTEESKDSNSAVDPLFVRLFTRQPLSKVSDDNSNRDTIKTLISKNTAKIKVDKSIVSRIKEENGLENCVVYFAEDIDLNAESTADVGSLPPSLTQKDIKSTYKFEYIVQEDVVEEEVLYAKFPECTKKSAVFAIIAQQNQFIKAFGVVQGFAKDAIHSGDMNQVFGEWSGLDVSPFTNKTNQKFMDQLSTMNFRIWGRGCIGVANRICYCCYVLINHRVFVTAMTVAVVLNTIVLALDHHGIDEDFLSVLNTINLFFSGVFLVEMVVKLMGLGFWGYLNDFMNYLDASVVIISCVEVIFLSGDSALTAFRTFRIFRVLRVARLFRYMQSMTEILRVLSSSIYNFVYLALLLLLFILIFSLLGMQIFGGQFNFAEGTPRANFDNFHNAFVTVFQILSLENWQLILYDGMRSPVGVMSSLFFIAWIFLGNFVLLNLFLAILLDSFSQSEDTANDDFEKSVIFEEGRRKSMRRESFFNKILKDRKHKMREEKIGQLERLFNDSEDSKSLEELLRFNEPKPLFYDVHCSRSFFIFSKESKLRILCYNLSNSMAFERTILLLISASSLKLIWDTYLLDQPSDSALLQVSVTLEIMFTVCFFIEFLIKAISTGFLMHHGCYLHDPWNQLDFFIIMVSTIEIAVYSIGIPYIKILRLLRTLRPLRFISHNISMKLVATALLESLCAILNVLIVLLIVWLMFAILGVSLFSGKFYTCEQKAIETIEECEEFGYVWRNSNTNFDNVIEAMISLLIISSLEGWPQIMEKGIDAKEVGVAPVRDYNPAVSYYFIVFILIGSFFFVNFFIGVVFMHFNLAKWSEASAYSCVLSKKQQKWLEMQELIVLSKPRLEVRKPHTNSLRKLMHKIVKHSYFETMVLIFLLLDMTAMALPYEGAPEDYIDALEILNVVFTFIFTLEFLMKVSGLGCKVYFASKWNRFDLGMVIGSLIELGASYWLESNTMMTGPARTVRLLRVSRLIRVFKDLRSLQDLIKIMAYSLNAILNVLSLLFLIFFIYATLGVFIFHDVPFSGVINEFNNFTNFGMAMIALFRVSTGEDWQVIMYECGDETGMPIAVSYFATFEVITMFVMLNLFIMVIVQTYEDYENDPKNTLQLFTADSKKFKKAWAQHSYRHGGVKIDYRSLPDFLWTLGQLDPKIGLESDIDFGKAAKILSTMDIHVDDRGFVYYNDLLYAVLRKRYAHRRNMNQLAKKILRREKILTSRKLNKIRNSADASRKLDCPHNLFITLFYAKRMFKAWKMWSKHRKLYGSSGSVTPEDSDIVFPGFNSFVIN